MTWWIANRRKFLIWLLRGVAGIVSIPLLYFLAALFLGAVPAGQRVAFEFRNASWQDDEVYASLRSRAAILCVTDNDEGDTPFVVTSDCGYVRLRRTFYNDDELRAWAERIAAQAVAKTYVYFMHEDEALGTRFAKRLNELWAARKSP